MFGFCPIISFKALSEPTLAATISAVKSFFIGQSIGKSGLKMIAYTSSKLSFSIASFK